MEKTIDSLNLISDTNERVIANILHDIKSPLFSIKIALQNNLDTELNRDIFEATVSILNYIENFLINYNFKCGKFNNKFEECDIKQIIDSKIKNYKYIFLNKNIHIDIIDEVNKNYKINSIKPFLSSIIGNIISNIAFHASINKDAMIKIESSKDCILINFQNSYEYNCENFTLGLEFSEKLSRIIKADLKFNKTKKDVCVKLKIPNLNN